MSGRVRMAVLVAAATLVVAWSGSAHGQQEVSFERVEVSLWPEYDRPAMLVIRRLTLDRSIVLPATVRLRIPVAAGIPNAVAEAEPSGNLVVASYERTARGEWAELSIEARYPRLQVEYYEPFDREGSRRNYRWVWPGDHPVAEMMIDVQEPVGTTDMQTAPPSPGGFPGPDGLTRHRLELGAVAAGEERVVVLDWARGTDELSVAAAAPPAETVPQPPASSDPPTAPSALYRALVGAGAAALAAAAVWFLLLRGGRQRLADAQKRQPPRRRGGTVPESAAARFCTACGVRGRKGDRFCHACGESLH